MTVKLFIFNHFATKGLFLKIKDCQFDFCDNLAKLKEERFVILCKASFHTTVTNNENTYKVLKKATDIPEIPQWENSKRNLISLIMLMHYWEKLKMSKLMKFFKKTK